MEYTWRLPLKDFIEEHYIHEPQEEWFDMNLSTSGLLNMTIVSKRFDGLPLQERRKQIHAFLRELNAPTSTGFLSLYTPGEAESIHLSQPSKSEENGIYSWLDLAQQAINATGSAKTPQRKSRIPRTIAFYSFKGGVGRTTALIHVAFILAMRGRKVVAVDLDLEAPGLGSTLHLTPSPQYGIVDYFYERSYLPEDVEPTISITDIFGEVHISDAPGRLLVVPAGSLSLDYAAKVDDLRANTVTESGEDLWSIFYREINEQLQPEIILVDSRTGINEWGAFSLLRAADQAIIFLYPNEQNQQGISLITKALSDKLSTSFVFSPVPSVGELGMEMVKKHWDVLQTGRSEQNADEGDRVERADPIVIPYLTEIALSEHYPARELLPHYTRIANVVDEDTNAIRLSAILTSGERRREIIDSLTFPSLRFPEAEEYSGTTIYSLFQRTADFDKLLDNTINLIRGREGTGKSTLYWLLLQHRGVANDLAYGRLHGVTLLSGHGSFHPGPTLNDFQRIEQTLIKSNITWEDFWRCYLLLRLHMENQLQPLLTQNRFRTLESLLNKVPRVADRWKTEHMDALIDMVTMPEMNMLAKDLLIDINTQQQKRQTVLWFLYDDLDQYLQNYYMGEKALVGLLQLVRTTNLRGLKALSFKIFLREDIWRRLKFAHKNYFNGRHLLLQWTQIDFMRLALRQALQSKQFKDVVDQFLPIKNVDQAGEDSIDEALQLLWGSRREELNSLSAYISDWIYSNLQDANPTTFPQTINTFLKEAVRYELQANPLESFPTDRLLRVDAIQEGLVKTSQERCSEIRQKYSELQPLFDFLEGKDALLSSEDLQKVWQNTIRFNQLELRDFQEFINLLRSIGLITIPRGQGEAVPQAYLVGNIYIYGFNMKHR